MMNQNEVRLKFYILGISYKFSVLDIIRDFFSILTGTSNGNSSILTSNGKLYISLNVPRRLLLFGGKIKEKLAVGHLNNTTVTCAHFNDSKIVVKLSITKPINIFKT